MGDFGSTYFKIRLTKYRGHDPVPRKKCNIQQENNSIVNIAVDEILLHENEKLSDVKEAPENVESGFYEKKIIISTI